MNTTTPLVYVVDDDVELGQSLCVLCSSIQLDSLFFPSGQPLWRAVDPDRPGCIVLDQNLEGESGLELARQLGDRFPHLPIIIYTGFATTASTVEAMRLDVFSVVEKGPNVELMVDVLSQAIEENARRMMRYREEKELRRKLALLSDSELIVLKKMLDNVPNKAIAPHLDVSLRTVENRRKSIFEKLELPTLHDIVRKSVEFADAFEAFLPSTPPDQSI